MIKAVVLNPLVGQTLKSFMAKVTTQALQEVGDLIDSGRITPVIDRTCPLTDAAAAVRLVEEGSPAGKVIVVVEPPRRNRHPGKPSGHLHASSAHELFVSCRIARVV